MRRTLHTKAIVLDTVKLKEQDLILTMIGEDGQKRRAVAKGARKPGGRFASRCDILCEPDLLLSAGRGPLPIVSEASLVSAHAPLREDIDSLSAASAAAELAEKSSYEDMPDPFLFKILSALLSSLEGSDAPHLMLAHEWGQTHLDCRLKAWEFWRGI